MKKIQPFIKTAFLVLCMTSTLGCNAIQKTLGINEMDHDDTPNVDRVVIAGTTQRDYDTVSGLQLEGNVVEVRVETLKNYFPLLHHAEYTIDDLNGEIHFGSQVIPLSDGDYIPIFIPVAPKGTRYEITIWFQDPSRRLYF